MKRTLVLFLLFACLCPGLHAQSIPRMPDGKPNFTGVWAGPGIPTDGRPHAKDVESTWMGDSVGRWEGDTLVIDTVGLKEWMLDATHDFNPDRLRIHSDQLHFIERLKLFDPTTVSYQVTIDDPKIFTAAWSQEFAMKLHPTWKILEFVCEENNRCMFGKCSESDAQKATKE